MFPLVLTFLCPVIGSIALLFAVCCYFPSLKCVTSSFSEESSYEGATVPTSLQTLQLTSDVKMISAECSSNKCKNKVTKKYS